MKDYKVIHSFEVPLYVVPNQDVREEMNLYSQFQAFPSASVTYWKEILTFAFVTENGEEHSCSFVPVPADFPKTRRVQISKRISSFASKFNCSMSVVRTDKGFSLIVDVADPNEVDIATYGKSVCAVIKATVTVTNLPTEMALNSLFSVIDSSPLVVGKPLADNSGR